VFHWESSRFFNKAALMKTHVFYERHGGKTLVITALHARSCAPSRPSSPASAK
jgi:hypothetical protein